LQVNRIHLLKTKNGSGRTIPLNSVSKTALERQLVLSGQSERVFVTDEGKPFIQKPIRRWFEEAIVKAKIRDFSWHCLRHTFCSRLVMAGVSLKTAQELMGHKTIQMTARYAHLSPGHLQDAVELLSGVNGHPTATEKPAKPTATRTATKPKMASRARVL
jgi:site-specific recombinase XerD